MNAITLRSRKRLKEPKGRQVEEDKGLAKDQGKEMVRED